MSRQLKFKEGDIVKFIHSEEYLLITCVDPFPMLKINPYYHFHIISSDKRKAGHEDGYEASWMEQLYDKVA